MYISVTIKPPCDGTCTKGSLYSLLVMVNVLKGHLKAFYVMVHVLKNTKKPT